MTSSTSAYFLKQNQNAILFLSTISGVNTCVSGAPVVRWSATESPIKLMLCSRMHPSLLLQLAFLFIIHQSTAQKDKSLYCAVCRALVEEVNARIGDVDPKKVLEVGSFRVGPDGSQKLKQKKYARSEVHLTEIFDDVCQSMSDYVEITQDDGSKAAVRKLTRSGVRTDLKNLKFSPNTDKTLRSYCDSLLEDFEEEMINLFGHENLPAIESAVCGETANACTEEELSRPVPSVSERAGEENVLHTAEDLHVSAHVEPFSDDDNPEDNEDDDSNVIEHSDKKGKKDPPAPAFQEEKDEL